jgi:soluble lytic murein transglycosylase-like protein
MHSIRHLAVCASLLLALPAFARAELVLLTNGSVVKVAQVDVRGHKALLSLPSGGVLTLDLMRIERVLEDEIAPEPEAPIAAAGLRLTFDPADRAPATPFGAEIYDAARRHGVNPALLAAMARVESAFDPEAVSHAGARGLMQLMPATAARFGVATDELFDPVRNLEASAGYVAWLTRRFAGDPTRVVAAYNAGEGAVERYGGVPRYRETQRYVEKVMGLLGAGEGPATHRVAATRTAALR